MKILITGAAGFIGFHLARRFCELGWEVLGVDNLNNYYEVSLKEARLAQLKPYQNFHFIKLDIADWAAMEDLFARHQFDRVLHMAAQAGVRYSLKNPQAYVQSNLVGFTNILEGCRYQWGPAETNKQRPAKHLVFASSSSVYGLNTKLPFSVQDNVDHPISLYAATKKANELLAHSYSHLYGMPTTGLRFFTVYGPWGRPDMAYYKFTQAIINEETIDVYNQGRLRRDFTYIDDVVEGVQKIANQLPLSSPDKPPYRIYNIGNNNPTELLKFIEILEEILGKKAKKNFLPMQAGDMLATYADIRDINKAVGFSPATPIEIGLQEFAKWYRQYGKLN